MPTLILPPELNGSISELRPGHVELPLGDGAVEYRDGAILRLECRARVTRDRISKLPDAIQSVRAHSSKTNDESVLAIVEAFPRLLELHVPSGRGVTDAACAAVRRLPRLRSINIGFSGIGDAGVAEISSLSELMRVSVANARLTDGGLAALGAVSALCQLTVNGNYKILGPGLEAFAGNGTLKYLFLNGTKVADEHVAHLAGCAGLMRIMLSSTNVTAECVLSLPRNKDCEVFLPDGLEGERLNELRRLRPELIINGVRTSIDLRDLEVSEGDAPQELPLPIRSDSPTLVLFTADWCQPCKWVKTAIDKVPISVRERFRYIEVDVEADPETAGAMRVQSLPTLMFIDGGREHARLVGAHKSPAIEDQMRALLTA